MDDDQFDLGVRFEITGGHIADKNHFLYPKDGNHLFDGCQVPL